MQSIRNNLVAAKLMTKSIYPKLHWYSTSLLIMHTLYIVLHNIVDDLYLSVFVNDRRSLPTILDYASIMLHRT